MDDREKRLVFARCRNCEEHYHAYGKACAFRSLGNEHCFDGMEADDAHKKIREMFDDFSKVIHDKQLKRVR